MLPWNWLHNAVSDAGCGNCVTASIKKFKKQNKGSSGPQLEDREVVIQI